ncbi:high frequency lysogenization protein HflD [Alkalilimnicola ehrlichii]|uniref:high frequency lysogenization protein HflD n=1 Tax=Alkalilimnicola ehrlichii TaxID=351052 RepID=UPI002163E144|nr:high frequency lysogenization protein HflD [Alkalilimnicola ehrlichii]
MRESSTDPSCCTAKYFCVTQVAQRGHANKSDVEPCLAGLLKVYDGDLRNLYGPPEQLHNGLKQLQEQLTRPNNPVLTRYLVAAIYLERRLRKRGDLMRRLGEGLEAARRQVDYFGENHPNVISNLAGLYADTVSTLTPRIMVQGNREYLEQPANAEMIRTLLLAAIRSISLWREAGGSRWKLLFNRRQILAAADRLLKERSFV